MADTGMTGDDIDIDRGVDMDVDADVVVVGGGPVGLAAAIGARQRGLSVVVVEPRELPVDKACGEGLMPGAVVELGRLGVHPVGHTLAGIAYSDSRRRVEHTFRQGAGLGVRRTELSALLLARALQCGVVFRRERVRRLAQDAAGVTLALGDGSGIRSRWLFGADGLHSTVRRLAGLERPARAEGAAKRYGLRQHFEVEPWSDNVEVFWSRGFEVYVTPVGDRMIGVAALGPRGLDFADVLRCVAPLASRAPAHRLAASPLQGGGSLRQGVRSHASGRVLLIGDASGYVDALTGEGMRVGFAQAAAALRAIAPHTPVFALLPGHPGAARPTTTTHPATRPVTRPVEGHPRDAAAPAATAAAAAARYERGWREASNTSNRLTTALLVAARSPLRPAIVPLAHRVPALFAAAIEQLAR